MAKASYVARDQVRNVCVRERLLFKFEGCAWRKTRIKTKSLVGEKDSRRVKLTKRTNYVCFSEKDGCHISFTFKFSALNILLD